MRQLLGGKKLRRLSERLGHKFVSAMVRGGTSHRIDLVDSEGWIWRYWPSAYPQPVLERDYRLESARGPDQRAEQTAE